MKKLMLLALLISALSCHNPEDNATGDADSSSYNKTGNESNLNTAGGGNDLGNQSHTDDYDTSMSPSTSKQNADTRTDGTNRAYKRDSSNNK